MEHTADNIKTERYALIDSVRGICVWGMILYHTLFDIVYISGAALDSPFMCGVNVIRDFGACCFIFISGLCFNLGRHKLKRSLLISAGGVIVTLVTFFVMPESFVIFGILTFLGLMGLIMLPLSVLLKKIPPAAGLIASLLLFLLFFSCNYGYIGYYSAVLCRFPAALYQNYFTAFFGFPFYGFISADYYPLLPWMFMYLCGFFFWNSVKDSEKTQRLLKIRIPLAEKTGRLSLYIYMLHQPLIFALVWGIYLIIA